MDAGQGAQGGGATSPTTSIRPGTGNSYKRKRSGAEFESSPGSGGEENEDEGERRRQPGVKRACNECRQQKLRCDVVQDPFTTCSRCNRLKLECKIESNFKRVGKRSKHAEMEKQIDRLRRQLQRAQAQGFMVEDDEEMESPMGNGVYSRNNQSFMGSDEAVSSLLHLKQGGSYSLPRIVYEIENVGLTEDATNHLFNEFWAYYHRFLPFLDSLQSPQHYYQQEHLLFWAIISVASRRYTVDPGLLTSLSGPLSRLLWQTVGGVPNNHFVVKALCLICTWPLPTSTTSTDPTHILNGVMMKAATGIGLHRPSHTQDFSRVSVDLNKEQLHDRVTTWAICNIVAQSNGTGYGQPASTLYDWTLAVRPGDEGPFKLSPELEARLKIERFSDKISKEMYSNASDPRGLAGDEMRSMLTRVYRREFNELQVDILSRDHLSPIANLHLKAAGLHLRLSAFFDSPTTIGYMDDLMGLWRAAIAFLDLVFEIETASAESMPSGFLRYATNYILQMMFAAGFTLLKLLSSFFAREIEFERGRQLFHRTIQAIRSMSVINNDLPWRLAELMVQMWNGARVEQRSQMQQMRDNGNSNSNGHDRPTVIDDTLQLKVRCRMSMSLVFDSIWRWREEFQAQGRGSIEAMKNPTNPDSAAESSASSTHMDSTLIPPSQTSSSVHNQNQLQSQLLSAANTAAGSLTPNQSHHGLPSGMMGGVGYSESNYEVFDPLNWMLDGLVDFPYSYAAVQGLEANGLG
ncbi:related to zinc finger transcription factor [Phialocephala subalpina]|uniref:Related to zinc finger transcription factor n=1 Tax=Phialocephala subalpina TaxID=576137 RepID=A0A1L7WRK0_9HELO|nr:related to zinc finger transcription factor [Phialocephala subalpina]